MTPREQLQAKAEARTKATYRAVRAAEPRLYERAVEIGHLAMISFGGEDENRRAAGVEAAVMSLIAELRDPDAALRSSVADTDELQSVLASCRVFLAEFAAAGNVHAPRLVKRIDTLLKIKPVRRKRKCRRCGLWVRWCRCPDRGGANG
jgi:hypothetical protein